MVPAEWDINEDREVVGRALAFTGKVVSTRFVETLSRCGGSVPAWLVLMNLARTGPVSQRELGELIHVDGATVTYHLDRLEAAGLVTRQRDPDDRRVWRAELTPAGTEAFDRMKQGALAFESALRDGLDDAELAQFFKVLDRLDANARAFDPSMISAAPTGPSATDATPTTSPPPASPPERSA